MLGLNEDFVDVLEAFLAEGVEFVVVGAHALAAHGVARATGDLDLFVRASPENAARVFRALGDFGAPLRAHGLLPLDFARPGTVYQIGLPPRRIDVITEISGADFDAVWQRRFSLDVGGLRLPFIGRDDFVANKQASGRPKDLADIALLSEIPRP